MKNLSIGSKRPGSQGRIYRRATSSITNSATATSIINDTQDPQLQQSQQQQQQQQTQIKGNRNPLSRFSSSTSANFFIIPSQLSPLRVETKQQPQRPVNISKHSQHHLATMPNMVKSRMQQQTSALKQSQSHSALLVPTNNENTNTFGNSNRNISLSKQVLLNNLTASTTTTPKSRSSLLRASCSIGQIQSSASASEELRSSSLKQQQFEWSQNQAQHATLQSFSTATNPSQLFFEKDERMRFLLTHGKVCRVGEKGSITLCELHALPGELICYRRPQAREEAEEKLQLDNLALSEIPIIEGEEKLRILTLRSNLILQLKNLVSLPILQYLDLTENRIEEITRLEAITQLKVLLLGGNLIKQIAGLEVVSKLEVLDLKGNKLVKVEGLLCLKHLKVVNLQGNSITGILSLEASFPPSVQEVNLESNYITSVEGFQSTSYFSSLRKLFLKRNRITELETIKKIGVAIPRMNEFSAAENNFNNDLAGIRVYVEEVVKSFSKELHFLDDENVDEIIRKIIGEIISRKKSVLNKPSKQADPNNKQISISENKSENSDTIRNSLIEEIENEWKESIRKKQEEEEKQEQLLQKQKPGSQRISQEKRIEMKTGHAEVEDSLQTSLRVYGSAFEVIISTPLFQQTITKLSINCVDFREFSNASTLQNISQFNKLNDLTLKSNNLQDLLAISCIETAMRKCPLKTLNIIQNPVNQCSLLKEFLVYRFPYLTNINGKEIKESDKTKAKQIFCSFDKILLLPSKLYSEPTIREYPSATSQLAESNKHLYMRVLVQTARVISTDTVSKIINCTGDSNEIGLDFNEQFDNYLLQLIEQELQQQKPY